MKDEKHPLTNEERLELLFKAFLRGVCTQEELDNRAIELGFTKEQADKKLLAFHQKHGDKFR